MPATSLKFATVWISLTLLMNVVLSKAAAETSVRPLANDLSITVPYGIDKGETVFNIANKSGNDSPVELTAYELRQEKTGKKAGLQVLCDDKEASVCLVKRFSTQRVKVLVSEITGFHKFEGRVVLITPDKKYSIPVVARKFPPPPALELVGAEKGRLKIIKDTPAKNSFNLIFKNPDNGVFRSFKITGLNLGDDGQSLKGEIKEKTFSLEPGGEKLITVFFNDIPKGSYQGILRLQDSGNKYMTQEFTILLRSEYLTLGNFCNIRMLVILLLVFSGGMVSILLTKCLPISAARRKNRQDIEACRERIQSLVVFETELRIKLIVGLIKAQTLNDNTKIFTPSANDRLKTVEATVAEIQRQLDVRAKVRDIYIAINSSDALPFSKEQEIRRILREADNAIYSGNLDFAEGRITEATSLQKFDLAREADLKQHSESLCRSIEGLLEELDEDAQSEGASSDIFIMHLIDAVKKGKREICKRDLQSIADKAWKKEDLINKVRELDLRYSRLDIYYSHFLKQIPETLRSDEELKEKIVNYLKGDSYTDIEKAIIYCNSASQGVREADIEQAISGGKVCIKHYPDDPDINKPVNFWLDFGDEKINKSSLRHNYRFIWDFNDRTSSTEGAEIFHYFKRRGWLILFRKWFTRNVSVILLRKASVWKTFSASVKISKCCGDCQAHYTPITKKIPVREPIEKEYSSGITFLDVLGYAVTFVLSCVVAAVTNFEDTSGFRTFRDLLSPFLIGFTLDVSRDKLLGSSKELLSKWKGGSK